MGDAQTYALCDAVEIECRRIERHTRHVLHGRVYVCEWDWTRFIYGWIYMSNSYCTTTWCLSAAWALLSYLLKLVFAMALFIDKYWLRWSHYAGKTPTYRSHAINSIGQEKWLSQFYVYILAIFVFFLPFSDIFFFECTRNSRDLIFLLRNSCSAFMSLLRSSCFQPLRLPHPPRTINGTHPSISSYYYLPLSVIILLELPCHPSQRCSPHSICRTK